MKVKAKWIVSGVFECVQDSGTPPCGGSRALQVERLEALTSAALEGVLYGLAAALRGSGEVRGLLAALAPKIEASAGGGATVLERGRGVVTDTEFPSGEALQTSPNTVTSTAVRAGACNL